MAIGIGAVVGPLVEALLLHLAHPGPNGLIIHLFGKTREAEHTQSRCEHTAKLFERQGAQL